MQSYKNLLLHLYQPSVDQIFVHIVKQFEGVYFSLVLCLLICPYRMFSNFLAEQKADPSQQLVIYGSLSEARWNIRQLRWLIRLRDGVIGNKMAEYSLVVEAIFRADIMRIWTSGRLQLTHGVKALEESNYSTADSSEYSPSRPPE